MSNLRRISPLVFMLLITVAAPGSAADEVVRIENGSEPEHGVETVVLKEMWRAGGEDDEIFFGNIKQVLGDRDGNVYVEDVQLNQTVVYTADGHYSRTLCRTGDGPGEVTNLNDMVWLPDGTLGMVQAFPGKIVKLDPMGDPAGTIPVGVSATDNNRLVVLMSSRSGGGHLLIAGMYWAFEEPGVMSQRMFLNALDMDGEMGTVFLEKDYPIEMEKFVFDEGRFDFIWSRFDVSDRSKIYFAPHRNAYEIHVCDIDGALERVITRRYESLRRDEFGKAEARMTADATSRHFGRPVHGVTVEDYEPDIEFLDVAEDGSLRVRSSRGNRDLPPGIMTRVDIFDDAGIFTRQIDLAGPDNALDDAVYLLPDGIVVVVKGAVDAYRQETGAPTSADEDQPTPTLEVVCYTY